MTAAEPGWQELVETLYHAVGILGINLVDLQAREEVDQLNFYVQRFPGEHLGENTPEALKELLTSLARAFGQAFSLQFLLGARSILQVSPHVSDEQVNDLLKTVQDGFEPILDLHLDKNKIIAARLPNLNPKIIAKFFFFPDALQRALSLPLTELESKGQLWYDNQDRLLVIIVPKHEIVLKGNYLVIIGGRALKDLDSIVAIQDLPTDPAVGWMREMASDPLSPVRWIYFKLKCLTPFHLRVEGVVDEGDLISEAVYIQLMNLCLVYSADRTKGPAEDELSVNGATPEWCATFSEEGYTTEVAWSRATRLPSSGSKRWSDVSAWSNLVSFAYSDKVYCFDRLRIVQLITARQLEGVGNRARYDQVVSQAQQIHKGVRDSWEAFIEGKIKDYFDQVRDIEQAVDDVTTKFQDQSDGLTQALIETALATVAALIGTFIAAAFHDPFNRWLFWIGIIVYLAYLLVFPHGLGLRAARERFNATVELFQKKQLDFKSRLSDRIVDGIVGNTLSKWKEQFFAWYRRIQLIYRLLAGLLVLIAIVVTFAIP